jgi:hypothetical protein
MTYVQLIYAFYTGNGFDILIIEPVAGIHLKTFFERILAGAL